MKLGIVMMLIASLSGALVSIPSKVAIAQTSPEDQTTQPRGLTRRNYSISRKSNKSNNATKRTHKRNYSISRKSNKSNNEPRGLTMPTTK